MRVCDMHSATHHSKRDSARHAGGDTRGPQCAARRSRRRPVAAHGQLCCSLAATPSRRVRRAAHLTGSGGRSRWASWAQANGGGILGSGAAADAGQLGSSCGGDVGATRAFARRAPTGPLYGRARASARVGCRPARGDPTAAALLPAGGVRTSGAGASWGRTRVAAPRDAGPL